VKFLRQEHIITTLSNREVSDIETIKNVLNNLKKEQLEFSLSVRKSSEWTGRGLQLISYPKAIVKKIQEHSVDFTIFTKLSVTNVKDVSFNNIVEIIVITTKNNIIEQEDDDVSRWTLMDIQEKE